MQESKRKYELSDESLVEQTQSGDSLLGAKIISKIEGELEATEKKLELYHYAFQNYNQTGKTFQSIDATSGWPNVPPRYGQVADIIRCLEEKKVNLLNMLVTLACKK